MLVSWTSIGKQTNHKSYLTAQAKTNWKWIIGQNVQPNAMKFLTENIGENLCAFEVGKILSRTQKAQIINEKSIPWTSAALKS